MDFRDDHARLRAEREAQAQARLAGMSPRERKRFFIRTAVRTMLIVVVALLLRHVVAGSIVSLILVGWGVAAVIVVSRRGS